MNIAHGLLMLCSDIEAMDRVGNTCLREEILDEEGTSILGIFGNGNGNQKFL